MASKKVIFDLLHGGPISIFSEFQKQIWMFLVDLYSDFQTVLFHPHTSFKSSNLAGVIIQQQVPQIRFLRSSELLECLFVEKCPLDKFRYFWTTV